MYDYVIIHGSYGTPFENWFPWLFNKLSEQGKNVLAPQFPCGSDIQNYSNWCKVMNAYKGYIGKDTSFIGHSLAPAFIIDYLLDNSLSVKNLYFAAPFYGLINIPDFDKVNKPFFTYKDFKRVKNLAQSITCYISTSDPYVPNELSVDLADKIGAKKVFVDNAGHFNLAAGYTHFEQLLEEMMKNE
jgi:hypothetical protein